MPRKDRGIVSVARYGKTFAGEWSVEKGLITVHFGPSDHKTTQLGGFAEVPESLARVLLSELITATGGKLFRTDSVP